MPASSYDSESSEESEEESGESYCSSDDAIEQGVNIRRASSAAEDEEPEPVRIDDTFSSRMRRIEAWRDAYAKAVGAELGEFPFMTSIFRHLHACASLPTLAYKYTICLRFSLT